MAGTDKLRFWEHEYATTTLDVKEAEGAIKEAHDILDQLKDLLDEKNKAYGNSALSDVNLFCNLSSIQFYPTKRRCMVHNHINGCLALDIFGCFIILRRLKLYSASLLPSCRD